MVKPVTSNSKKTVSLALAAFAAGLTFGLSGWGRAPRAEASVTASAAATEGYLDTRGVELINNFDSADALRHESDTDASEMSSEERRNWEDAIRASQGAPDRSPAVLPQDDAETASRRNMYLDFSAEPPTMDAESAAPAANPGVVQQGQPVVDEQRQLQQSALPTPEDMAPENDPSQR